MDALPVLIIAIVTFAALVLLTWYFLKMAMLMGKQAREARSNIADRKKETAATEENAEDGPSE